MDENNKKPASSTDASFFREIDIEFLVHELKTPIAVSEASLETLLTKKEKFGSFTDKQEKIIKRAVRNIKKAREMIYSLLETGRSEAETFHYAPFNPFDALYEVLLESLEAKANQLFAKAIEFEAQEKIISFLSENGVIFNIDSELKEKIIRQDETKFRHITGNIIRNALQYKKEYIRLTISFVENYINIEIEDDGCGIMPKHHEAIFHRYKQIENNNPQNERTSSGHGLGLAGSLIMSKRLGGNIKVKSDKNSGTLFQITLPV